MKKETGKKFMMALSAGVLAGSMAVGSAMTAFAATDAVYTKKENVYVTMDGEGKVAGTYVVNSFHVTKEGEITDIGDYDRVQNLTDLSEIATEDDEHVFVAPEGKFYYQGDMGDKELPWLFEVSYKLDGDKLEPEELAGAEGDLELDIHIEPNTQAEDKFFSDAYMLQVSITLDSKLCKNVSAEGATLMDVGGNEQITFTVMPGSEADLSVTAEVEGFEMDNISLTGILAQGAGGASSQAEEPEPSEESDGQEALEEGEQEVPEGEAEQEASGNMEEASEDREERNVSSGAGVPSFASTDNQYTEQVVFLMTVEGISIPEEEIIEEVVVEKSFVQKLKDLLNNF